MRGYWRLKEEVLDRTLWITRYGKGYGPVVRQATEGMNMYFAKVLRELRVQQNRGILSKCGNNLLSGNDNTTQRPYHVEA
jgi:hypothetical protein